MSGLSELSHEELIARCRKVCGVAPPKPGAPRRDWLEWFVKATFSIGLKKHRDPAAARAFLLETLRERSEANALLAIVHEKEAGAQQGGDPVDTLLQ